MKESFSFQLVGLWGLCFSPEREAELSFLPEQDKVLILFSKYRK
jgi:hypothetical protein